MRRLALLLVLSLCVVVAGTARAQSPVPRIEVGGALSYWRLDRGTASAAATTRAGGAVSMGIFPGATGSQVGVQLLASYAPEADTDPGILSGLAELEIGFGHRRTEGARLALLGGVGALRFATERQDRVIERCTPETWCLYEGIAYRGGWRAFASGGMKGDLPIGRSFAVQPQVRAIVHPTGRAGWTDARNPIVRADLGVVWRR